MMDSLLKKYFHPHPNPNPLPSRERGNLFSPDLRITSIFFVILFTILSLTITVSYATMVKFKDEVGREVTFSFPPKRIVSLAPNITEILFSLGLDEEVVGISIHCNYPEKVKTRPRVGSYISLNFERIVSLKPDLIIATGAGNTKEMVDRLERLGFPTFVIFPKRFDDVIQSILNVGQLVSKEKEALSMTESMSKRKGRIIELTRGLSGPKVFLQIGESPIVTVGKGSFADDLIRLAGGENVAGNDREMYPRLGMEEILKRSPEVILISSMRPGGDYERALREWERWKTIPAVKQGRIHLIDSDLIDRPSPRIIDGLEEMARWIHPERFKKSMQN
ncbi:MAG: cobalamin-binding protein [Deltaproteobacteria bacterium]|nr:cobalamin-binding protein [Deltaproteobacteria bacterium]